ncbi:hypothetical protein VTI74DRAFT_1481 [Chaetomium olivicolor]
MDATNSTNCASIQPNADVSGMGIRASIYALCLGGRLLNLFTKLFSTREASEEFERSYKNSLSIQGMALLCTAWYESTHGQLTLFHAMVVLHLVSLLGINLASRISPKKSPWIRFWMNSLLIICAVSAFIAFNVYVWIRAPDFGSQPECNSTVVYVLFGNSINATNPIFRYIILATLAAIPGFFVIFLILGLPCWIMACCLCREDMHCKRNPVPLLFDRDDTSEDGPKPVNWTHEMVQIMAYMAFSIYAIVSLEQMISRNRVSEEESQWTFGQIIALFLLLGPTVDFFNAVAASFGKKTSISAPSHRD